MALSYVCLISHYTLSALQVWAAATVDYDLGGLPYGKLHRYSVLDVHARLSYCMKQGCRCVNILSPCIPPAICSCRQPHADVHRRGAGQSS